MEQQFACPHCTQILTSPSFAATQQVQCPHCGGLFAVTGSAEAEPAVAISSSDRSASYSAGGARHNTSNLKFVVAGAVMLAAAGIPVVGFLLFASSTKPAQVARVAAAEQPAAQEQQATLLTGTFIKNEPGETNASRKEERVDRSSPSKPAGTPAPPQVAMAPRNAARTPTTVSAPVSAPVPVAGGVVKDSSDVVQPAASDTTALVQRIEPSVVVIQVTCDKSSSIGSGFPLDDQGTIVTNYHVIEGATSVKIKFGEKTADVQGFLVYSPGKDIAILKANLGAARVAPLKLAGNPPVKGETVLTFGAPLGFDSTVSNGIISSVRKGSDLREIFKKMTGSDVYVEQQHYDLDAVWVQTTAPISGGNSGGPLVNLRGEVVGLNTWHLVAGQNMNFAISANHIKEMMKSANSGVHPFSELPKPRERTVVAGTGKRTLEYWEEVSRINRGLASKLRRIKQPPLPSTKQKLIALFPKLAGIYKKLGDIMPDAGAKLKALKIDDVDTELVALVTVDAITLDKIGEAARDMSVDAKRFNAEKVGLYDAEVLSKKAFGKFDDLELGQAYDVMRIRLTNRYGMTFASIFDASRGGSSAKADDGDDDKDAAGDGDNSAREKLAAGKLKTAKQLKQAGKRDAAKDRLQQIVDDYAGTKAAKEAQTLLDEIE